MPETITIGGKKMNKNVVYIGGAAAAGFVAYAWYKNGTSGEVAAPELPLPVPEPTDDPGFSVTGGIDARDIRTNADWSELAISRLINIGIDAPAVSSAIGKFLARKPLNPVEADLVRQAIRAAGYPPVDGPWVVIEETPGQVHTPPPPVVTPPPPVVTPPPPPAVGPPPAPANSQVAGGRGFLDFAWAASPGATWYEISRMDEGGNTGWENVGNRTAVRKVTLVSVPTQYRMAVRAGGPGGYSDHHWSSVFTVYP